MNRLASILILTVISISTTNVVAQVPGCTDMPANNYNPSATVNDGSCLYNGSTINPSTTWSLPAALVETSGLTMLNNNIWTHNDNSDLNLYALDTANITNFQSYSLAGTSNIDWEEVTRDSNYFYIGDFGNNANGNRTNLKILRVEINSVLANTPVIDTIYFSYSLQTNFNPTGANNTNFDCEAFIVTDDSIYLFTKEWISQQTTIYSLPKLPGTHIAQFQTSHNVQGLITGATFIESKRLIVLCGYSTIVQPFLYLLYDFNSTTFFGGNKRKVTVSLPFHQVEGIATNDGLTYFISNEKLVQGPITTNQKLHRLDLTGYLLHYLDSTLVSASVFDSNNTMLYPNPSSNNLVVDVDDKLIGDSFVIISADGKIVYDGIFEVKKTSVNVSHFTKATYYMINKSRNLVIGKFVKN